MDKKKGSFWMVLLWGSVWGITEATLGYLLHFIKLFPAFSGMLLFPIAVWILRNVYIRTSSGFAVLCTGFVAAAIKSVDFLFPFLPAIKTFNPIFAILAEALLVTAFINMSVSEHSRKRIPAALFMSLSWRLVFIAANLFVFLLTGDGILKYGLPAALRFIVLNGIAGSVLVWAALLVPNLPENKTGSAAGKLYPVLAAGTLAAAVGTEILFLYL